MRKVVVTGGAGFVGSHLVDALVTQGDDIHVIDNFSAGEFPDQLNSEATYHRLDIRDYGGIAPIIAETDAVFHLAADVSVSHSVGDPRGTHDVNVNGTLNVLEAVRAGSARCLVYVSSAAVYGTHAIPPVAEDLPYNPTSPYGVQKAIGEQYVRLYHALYGTSTVIIRPFNIYGQRQRGDSPYAGAVARFVEIARRGETIVIEGDGEQTRDFTHVSDVVRALMLAMGRDEAVSQTINLGTGVPMSINETAQLILKACGRVGEPQHKAPRVGDIRYSYADVSRAKELLGWEAEVALEDGLRMLMRAQ